MSAELIKGMPIANKIREEIIVEVEKLKTKGINPKLAVLLVGDDEASVVYARSKEKVGDKLGIGVELTVKPADTTEEVVLDIIDQFNADENIHGILVELPLPKAISKENVMARLDPKKDVDGVHPVNRGYLLGGQEDMALIPATPLACVELMTRAGVKIRGKRVALVGRGDTVGRPLASLLIKRDATITICHTKTKDIPAITKAAEIVVVAAGRINLVTGDMLSPGQVVIDAGINAKEGGGITGDVEFEAAEQIVDVITPVPGGVGSLTTTIIMNNLIKAITLQGKA
ncbi:MAG: bifunctional 5,10-methylenetetrahydrofolate dehydrogenase/5,10-methenyltetrahydrofolate cyclohydrolase [Deltaproteobacteria bacterium]|nr:bifunctional 5,10-methylenetetrahydrofolate dehydrogenase/5,10-methenyltetrahydrofolate cyclohydrolase [Deltaproteobacteria bacterium]MBW2051358.1 bifunctional 5,10-methylenetetrahydrofolate dehydrogenase/5,10-methenyltetrahydrofolate cyclohydrolase [Deltaproteobacteria bacterium]MBW2139983.1 bifunctional 5,10-methylenetetrahydrofolate dehydrogenase/5,10-methenyltetrahydrofolate cyclohydrolase [Deltaproteobacteria bacterium]MBW2324795.1 bifunctional 5,10-methylenetetrahydrofolate dehydrogenas